MSHRNFVLSPLPYRFEIAEEKAPLGLPEKPHAAYVGRVTSRAECRSILMDVHSRLILSGWRLCAPDRASLAGALARYGCPTQLALDNADILGSRARKTAAVRVAARALRGGTVERDDRAPNLGRSQDKGKAADARTEKED